VAVVEAVAVVVVGGGALLVSRPPTHENPWRS
jgi:hypothetical protein